MGAIIKANYPEAASGTVEVFKHGSTLERAEVFSDWEGETPITSYTLDPNGRWKGFVFELVDVVIKDVNGQPVDDWTDGTMDTLVGVNNNGFTGTLSDGSQGLGGDVLLSEILSRIRDSNGAPDGYVRETGTSTDLKLKDALRGLRAGSRPFFVVEDYGAVSGGAVDARPGIQAAIDAASAAGGGTVFFKAPLYTVVGGLTIPKNTISLMGSATTLLQLSTNVPLLQFNAGVATHGGGFVSGLTIDGGSPFSATASQSAGITVVNAPGYLFDDVYVLGYYTGWDLQSRAILNGCRFLGSGILAGTPTVAGVHIKAGADRTQIFGGHFEVTNGAAGIGAAVMVVATRCDIIGADLRHIGNANDFGVSTSESFTRVIGCHIESTGGVLGAHINVTADVDVTVGPNTYGVVSVCALYRGGSNAYTLVKRRGEQQRKLYNVAAAGTATIDPQFAENHVTVTGTPVTIAVPVTAGTVHGGLETRYTARNTTGAPSNVTNSAAGSGTHINGTVVAVPAGKTATWTLRYNDLAAAWDEISFATG